MHKIVTRLLVYRNLDSQSILFELARIYQDFYKGSLDEETTVAALYEQIHRLLDLATSYGFDHNLWHCYLAFLLATTENPFSLTCEKAGARDGSVNLLVRNDFAAFYDLLHYDFAPLEKTLQINCFSVISNYRAIKKDKKTYNSQVSAKVIQLSQELAQAADEYEIFRIVTGFYQKYGVGNFGLNTVFRLAGQGQSSHILPITNTAEVYLSDLIGYEAQKKALVANTESFISGKGGNNLLLYGDSGTGKSTCVKALLNEYQGQGLRMIEVYKHQLQDLAGLISRIKNRNYRFIIFMDDLSFEDFETEFKYLKAIIEGGLEITPDNVLIYATSNRRHLIRETWTDREEAGTKNDIHATDSVEEKLSLVNRFGVTIRFDRPGLDEYLEIVQGIATRHPQIMLGEEELRQKAQQWATWHGNRSGRRAQQFINHLLGNQDSKDQLI